jgi:hypothetical protein
MTLLIILFIFVCELTMTTSQAQAIDRDLARQYFTEMNEIAEQDAGSLWGHSLVGPIIFINPMTREIVASQADGVGQLVQAGDVYVGKLPKNVNVAYTAMDWAGVRWTMLMWPFFDDPVMRRTTMVHESYHRIQPQVGLPMLDPVSDHLAETEARIWLQMEWRALSVALAMDGSARQTAVADALTFRVFRRSLYPGAAEKERVLEMNEGVAEYTGVRLGGGESPSDLAREKLKEAEGQDTYVRNFAYTSGAAYGLLLDDSDDTWRTSIGPDDDLGLLLAKATGVDLPADLEAQSKRRALSYDGKVLREAEEELGRAREERMRAYRERLVDGPVLRIEPKGKRSFSMSPQNMQSMGDLGTVYPTLRVASNWGILEVDGGALMNAARSLIRVEAPTKTEGDPIVGPGWTLELKAGWALRPGEREGDWALVEVH